MLLSLQNQQDMNQQVLIKAQMIQKIVMQVLLQVNLRLSF